MFPPIFLQTVTQPPEVNKVAMGAIEQAGKHANEAGPLTYFWFVVAVISFALCVYFYHKADKAVVDKNKACDEAVAGAKVEWAKERAIDNGNWSTLVSELKGERLDLLNRLERINQELRQQEGKSIDVIASLRNALGQVHQLLAAVDQRLALIESYVNNATRRPAQPISPLSPFPGTSPDLL